MLRPELQAIVDRLQKAHPNGANISIDTLGEAVGTLAVSHEEIDQMMHALEQSGRRVEHPNAGSGPERLGKVVASARALKESLGRSASRAEIAAHAGMTEDEVAHALALAKVMQR